MRAIGYLAICATVGGILALSTPFTERRGVKAWAPNIVVAPPRAVATAVDAPKPPGAADALAAPRSVDTAVNAPKPPVGAEAIVNASRPSHVPEAVVSRGEPTAPAAPAAIVTEPQETGALPKQADATAREVSRGARKRPREARPSPKLTRPHRLAAQIPAIPIPSSREPIQFRLAEGRH
jgi:hypothetical protein